MTITPTTSVRTCKFNIVQPQNLKFHKYQLAGRTFAASYLANSTHLSSSNQAQKLVYDFNPNIPVERAVTPPSSWYTDHSFIDLELDRVFYRGWQVVGCTQQLKEQYDFFTGRLGSVEFVVCRDDKANIHAFHNVCRHHASLVACGSGKKSCFVCPYHGWTYGLDGALLKATRVNGIQDFNANELRLVPIKVATWGPLVLLNLDKNAVPLHNMGSEWLGDASELLAANCVDTSLTYLCRREYTIDCNWKVFCDNYLDGGYHVPYAHKGLASALNLDSYTITMFERVSIQSCDGGGSITSKDDYDRLGNKAFYAFVYPNFMINRYGPWMDTNLVLPLGPRRCQVIFDYYLEHSMKDDTAFIEKSLEDSERVQMEDIMLSEGVQRGLESPAYSVGRYAPQIEKAMHHFHCLLHTNLKKDN